MTAVTFTDGTSVDQTLNANKTIKTWISPATMDSNDTVTVPTITGKTVRVLSAFDNTTGDSVTATVSSFTITVDAAGVVRIHDLDGNLINDAFASGLAPNSWLAFGSGGMWGANLYAVSFTSGELLRIEDEGTTTVLATGFDRSHDIAFGPDGAMYVSMFDQDRILLFQRLNCHLKPN